MKSKRVRTIDSKYKTKRKVIIIVLRKFCMTLARAFKLIRNRDERFSIRIQLYGIRVASVILYCCDIASKSFRHCLKSVYENIRRQRKRNEKMKNRAIFNVYTHISFNKKIQLFAEVFSTMGKGRKSILTCTCWQVKSANEKCFYLRNLHRT